MQDNLTDDFVNELYQLTQEDIPPAVLHQARKCLLDYIGVTFAGAKMLGSKADRYLNLFGPDSGGFSIVGIERKTSFQNAVLLNGICSHVAELDDGERVGMMHPGTPVISALLPLLEQEKISGEQLLLGIVIGYEAALRIAGAVQPAAKDRGYHATGTCGTIGAALGVGAALGFSKAQMKDALSSAATGASGILEVIRDDSELKPYNAGNAALSGMTAAYMARAGFKGPVDALGGKHGFLSIMADNVNISRLQKQRKDPFAIERIYVKPYAACRHCHSAIDAVLQLSAEQEISTEEIEQISVRTYWWAVGGHDHTDIEGVSSAKMSIPYSVAVAFVMGKAGLAEFTPECVENAEIRSLTQKVKTESDDELTALVPGKRAAIVEITTHAGQRYSARVDLPKGEPETALTDKELDDKFMALAQFAGVSSARASQISHCVFDEALDAETLAKLLQA